MVALFAAAGAYVVTRVAEQGLADSMGLMTLRHGTDPLSWIAIHLLGINPERDMSALGSSLSDEPNYMVATTSDQYGIQLPEISLVRLCIDHLPEPIQTKVSAIYDKYIVRLCASIANSWVIEQIYNFTGITDLLLGTAGIRYGAGKITMHTIPLVQSMGANLKRIHQLVAITGIFRAAIAFSIALIPTCLTPTIKIRIREDIHGDIFRESEKSVARVVLIAQDQLSPTNIGLLGTLKNLRFPPLLSHPWRVVVGFTKISGASLIIAGTYLVMPQFIAAYKVSMLAGAVLAVL